MKISKKYLKQVIKEELEGILKENERYDEILVRMPSRDFLELTTNEDVMDMLRHDQKTRPLEYSEARAGELLLNINEIGTVTSHEGRHRAFANIIKNGENATNTVIIRISNINYSEFIKSGYAISGQYDKSVKKEPQKYPIAKKEEATKDYLKASKEPLVFKSKIYPPSIYTKKEMVEPGYKAAIAHINIAEVEYVKAYKKSKGIEVLSTEEKNQLAKEFEKYVNENYNIYDSSGNKLKVVDASKAIITFSLIPLPEPKETVTIEKNNEI
jgi:hypothetical protein